MNHTDQTITVEGLKKSYGKLTVLDGINFTVKRGTIQALLGPNGAGKTTIIKILSTLLDADSGTAMIEGHEVTKEPSVVRSKIGLTGQYAAVDEYLSGEENLHMMGRLYRLSKADTKRRGQELLALVDLVDAAKRPVRTYSGGMKRRLDLAMSLIANPPVIFLDEPTTGLDPRSRLAIWDMIKELSRNGTTILLTTQYLEEADLLADNIIVIDGGKVIAKGTADELKAKVGSDRLEVAIGKSSSFAKACELFASDTSLQVNAENRSLSIASKGGIKKLKDVLLLLENAKIAVDTIALQRPALDDVFLTLTGHAATIEEDDSRKQKGKG
ncbi:MAG TPA: ATP-binding cassette domain-containing protein [Candidatus Saccharimonadales bacterium]|nr:ATP-binding cassette domain-containing protein [Candidatus Saccharimonadales bacterium]